MHINSFVDACIQGDMSVVLSGWYDDESLYQGYRGACMSGQWEVVRHLLNLSVGLDNRQGFVWACAGGHLDLVCHFLALGLTEGHEDGLRWAVIHRHWSVIRYLVTEGHACLHAMASLAGCINLLGREFTLDLLEHMPSEQQWHYVNNGEFASCLNAQEQHRVLSGGMGELHNECDIFV